MKTVSLDELSPIQKAWIKEIAEADTEQLKKIIEILTSKE